MAGSASFLWVAAGLVGLATVAPGLDHVVGDLAAEVATVDAIPRAPDGQYYVEATVGEARIRFMVDGGVDGVVLAPADAERIGLGGGRDEISRLSIGAHMLDKVPARVGASLPVSLIGRSTLARAAVDFAR